MGFPGLGDAIAPCPLCFAGPENYFSCRGLSPVGAQWHRKEQRDLEEACRSCEVKPQLTRDAQVRVRALLQFDKTPTGPWGRALEVDLPELGLNEKDRVGPSKGMQNITDFDEAPV
eukprot:15266755-Alexandrium_andersonii.AAC.1